MKKLMTMFLALSFLTATVPLAFGDDAPKKHTKKPKKVKKPKVPKKKA
jgi:hypothetical protein